MTKVERKIIQETAESPQLPAQRLSCQSMQFSACQLSHNPSCISILWHSSNWGTWKQVSTNHYDQNIQDCPKLFLANILLWYSPISHVWLNPAKHVHCSLVNLKEDTIEDLQFKRTQWEIKSKETGQPRIPSCTHIFQKEKFDTKSCHYDSELN